MTTTNDTVIYDKHGKRVHRANGIIETGDKVVVAMRFMDAASTLSSVRLHDAEGDAPPTREELDAIWQRRVAATSDAWRHPNQQDADKQTQTTNVEDAIEQRNRRLENAWRS